MLQFIDLTLGGISSGAVYASAAVALVLIWRATRTLNFAQGAMMGVSALAAGTVYSHTSSYWMAVLAAVLIGAVLGAFVQRVIIGRIRENKEFNSIVITLGLLILIEAVAGMIWGATPHSFPPILGITGYVVAGHRLQFSSSDLAVLIIVAAFMAILAIVFQKTSLGLRMRASAFAPGPSTMYGIDVGMMYTIGWALSCGAASLAGVLIAPQLFVTPGSFDSTLVYAFTGAVIGGLDNPIGAMAGGLLVGITLNYASGYIDPAITTFAAVILIAVVLAFRPEGIFSRGVARHV